MPCRSEHMEPSALEKEHQRLLCLSYELKTGEFPDPKNFGNGSDIKVYGKTSKEQVDTLTAEICNKLQDFDEFGLGERSLELQMWWRDHQLADKKRIENSLDKAPNGVEMRKVYNSLTKHERDMIDAKYAEMVKEPSDEEKFVSEWLQANIQNFKDVNLNDILLKFSAEFCEHFNK